MEASYQLNPDIEINQSEADKQNMMKKVKEFFDQVK